MPDLKNEAVDGILWTSFRSIVTVLSGPLLLIVQAQYLTPSEFGVLSVINVVLSIINVIENFGFSTAVIQRDHVSKNEKSSLFFFQIIFALLIALIIVLISPITADFFDMPSLIKLMPLMSIIVLLNGPTLLFTSFLEKEFYFKELSIINIIRQVILFLATTLFLVKGLGLTGVVLGQIVAVFVMVVLVLWVSLKNDLVHIQPHFSITELKPYIKFGLSIGSKQVMTQLTHHIDELIIGYFLSSEELGFYFFAKNLLNRIRTLVTTAFSKVLLPLLSKLKHNVQRLTTTYNDISKYIGIFAFPLFIGIALTADQFIPVLFGSEWLPSVDFFVILSIAYIPYLLTSGLATNLLYSVNKPHWVLQTEIVVNIIYILALVVVSWLKLGIYGVVWIYAFYLVGKTMTLQYLAQENLYTTFKDYILLFKSSVISTIAMITAVVLAKNAFSDIDELIIELILTIVVGVASYIITYLIIDKQTLNDVWNLVFKRQ